MDKSWIGGDRTTKAYADGVQIFIDFAYRNKDILTSSIKCPCSTCVNRVYYNSQTVRNHIEMYGFEKSYKNWIYHGESLGDFNINVNSWSDGMAVDDVLADLNSGASMIAMVQEGRGIPCREENMGNDEEPNIEDHDVPDADLPEYFRLLKEAQSELYENCPKDITELSFVVELLHLKQLNGWTNRSFTMLMLFLQKVFPKAKIPKSFYQANKLTKDLGFKYETWDACPKSCMLFRNESENLEKCKICGESRFKNEFDSGEGTKVAAKKVRYFPLKPRLQRLYWSSHTAPLMKWHADERIDDGVLRHPADSLAWKTFDERNPSFASDCRNVRLALATDGFNPFGNMSIAHSTWPIVLMILNLPPWLCMKQPHLILSVLIDGPKGPGDKIDVYLQPLIDELKELWANGVRTYDESVKQFFQLHAALLWTISDFPGYAMLSGWSTKGEFACPCCNKDHQAIRLTNGRKYCYWGHRRFLPMRHKFRKEKVTFNGKVDMRPPPLKLTGSQVLQQLNELDVVTEYKKEDVLRRMIRDQKEIELAKKTKGNIPKKRLNWKKKSIFFELQYWEHNLIRHNLDVMHIEKNFCDNILFTLLGIKGKTKDNLNARKDLKEMSIRRVLHPQPRGANQQYVAPAEFTMSNKEKDIFLKVLLNLKVPDGYSSNISRCVHPQERSIWGLKSHDNHILMQQLLPIAVRRVLPKHVVKALIELSNCFAILCSSVNTLADLEKFEDRMALTLCSLEKIFPPGFFDVMEHLPMHLTDELLIVGSVLYRWMYPMERYLHTLKLYVRNRAHPEASIAKSVLLEECMTFCSRYLGDNVETKSSRPIRTDDKGNDSGRAVGKKVQIQLDEETLVQAHRYVLFNTDSVAPFIE